MARRKSAERTLVTDLQQQVTALVDDLRSQSDTDPALHAKLTTEHQRALTAQRIAINYTDWREDRLTQIAVAWVLGTVFVRYCEDNELIDDPWISGPGERLKDAEDRHAAHFRKHPDQNDRDWLLASFTHLAGTHPAVAGLFDKAHNPLWEADPSYEAATALLNFWRTPNAEGAIPYLFQGQDTRFLGDLYQDLSTHAQKTYALLQTPDFVEEFILDLTLTPALEQFGLTPEWRHTPPSWQGPRNDSDEAIGLRTIDPACGSGHFLLGLFHRILAAWEAEAPGLPRWDLIRRTLGSVHGCDKNPFAAAIARFRLLVAALNAAGETRLSSAPSFPINIAVGDSLLHGRGALGDQGDLFATDEPFYFATEDSDEFSKTCDLLGINSYHVVVGNPPYITVKDKQESTNYRLHYPDACSGAFALSAPFAQRIFDLAILTGGADRRAGFAGQITANSFMKREFGKKLIERFFRTIDLTYVIDTSGAYIPGHGTPTVILAGRNRIAHRADPVRAVLGIRGEPGQPKNAAEGLVWTAITTQTTRANSESAWISTADIARGSLDHHPWSLSGGGALNLFEFIEESSQSKLKDHADEFGFGATTKEDEAYFLGEGALRRFGIPASHQLPFIEGVFVRDYSINSNATVSLWPYNRESLNAEPAPPTLKALWPYRTNLKNRTVFGKTQEDRRLTWFEYSEFAARRFRNQFTITFAFVSTHNHFVLDRGGKVFNRSAPIIKLPKEASEADHLGLLGLLNSSTACFWLKQVSQGKGGSGINCGIKDEAWEERYEFTGTKLGDFPLPEQRPITLARQVDSLARQRFDVSPRALCSAKAPTRERFEAGRAQNEAHLGQMVAAQEELDWQVYGLYGLLSASELAKVTLDDPMMPQVRLGERAFEIVLARKVASGEAETAWFERHRSQAITDIPDSWDERYAAVVRNRIELIEKRRDIALLERPEYKRRWSSETCGAQEREALKGWILDRCEQEGLWFAQRDGLRHPRAMSLSEFADRFRDDGEMKGVAELFARYHLGKRDLPLAGVLEEVLREEHVPYLSALRYKDSGMRNRAEWEKAWELQRQEDREERELDIPVPPKYKSADFKKFSYWAQRGKLDVPKERFISYLGAARHKDDPLLLGWAGWDHKDQAQALVNLVNDRQLEDGWGREQLLPVLAGLLEVMPWVRQWHGEYDAEWDGNPAEEFQAFLGEKTAEFQISERELREWRPSKEFLKGARG